MNVYYIFFAAPLVIIESIRSAGVLRGGTEGGRFGLGSRQICMQIRRAFQSIWGAYKGIVA